MRRALTLLVGLLMASFVRGQSVEIQIVPEVFGPFANYHIKVGGFENMVGVQGTFEWNSDSIEFVELTYIGIPGMFNNNFNLTQADSGRLFYLWFGVGSGVSLDACETMFTFRFRILEGLGALRQPDDGMLPIEFTNSDFQQLGVTTFMVEECSYTSTDDFFYDPSIVTIYPNPIRAGTYVYWDVHFPDKIVRAELYDNAGKLVRSERRERMENHFFIPETLQAGLYYLRLQTSSAVSIHPIALTLK